MSPTPSFTVATEADKPTRPCVYWGMSMVALHFLAHGERVSKKNLMLELPRTAENERLLVAMGNAGRAALGIPAQGF